MRLEFGSCECSSFNPVAIAPGTDFIAVLICTPQIDLPARSMTISDPPCLSGYSVSRWWIHAEVISTTEAQSTHRNTERNHTLQQQNAGKESLLPAHLARLPF